MPKTLKLNCDSSAGQTVKNLTGLNGATGTPAASYAVTLSDPFDGSGTISVGDDLVGRFVGRLVSSADELLSRAYWDVADNAWAAGSESELDQAAAIAATRNAVEADEVTQIEGGVLRRRLYQRGTATELIPRKTAKQVDGTDLTDPTTQRLGQFVEG